MDSILPIITMSDLQRCAKERLEGVKDYAVIRKHAKDVAFVLHPSLGKVLLESGLLDVLKQKLAEGRTNPLTPVTTTSATPADPAAEPLPELDRILGQVLRELSRR